jgi:hypothetical protein
MVILIIQILEIIDSKNGKKWVFTLNIYTIIKKIFKKYEESKTWII